MGKIGFVGRFEWGTDDCSNAVDSIWDYRI